jgi:glycosidase
MKLMAAIQLLLPGMPFLYYGDEVGMTGGPDPDCRRGMLWDEDKQDKDMLAYYQRLIRIRKAHPCLTEEDPDDQLADDEKGLVTIRRGDLVLLFHSRDGEICVDMTGRDLITDLPFSGKLGPYQAAVLQI